MILTIPSLIVFLQGDNAQLVYRQIQNFFVKRPAIRKQTFIHPNNYYVARFV